MATIVRADTPSGMSGTSDIPNHYANVSRIVYRVELVCGHYLTATTLPRSCTPGPIFFECVQCKDKSNATATVVTQGLAQGVKESAEKADNLSPVRNRRTSPLVENPL